MPYEEQFAALAHPLRQKIITELMIRGASVRELTDTLAASQPVVSQHLRVLKEAGFVSAEPQGMKRIYHIEPERLRELRAYLQQHWLKMVHDLGDDDDD